MLSGAKASLPLRWCGNTIFPEQSLNKMRHDDMPERWKNKVQAHLLAKGETKYKTLGAADFSSDSTVKIRFKDDSKVEFKYAFVIKAPEFREVGVFTDHCGYHLFPLYEGLEIVEEEDGSESFS